MTRALNGTIATDFGGSTTTFCHCWQITLTNGTVIRLTNHDQNLTFLGETFTSTAGFDISMIEAGENLAVDNGELEVLLATNFVQQSDIINGFYDGARVKVYLVNWSNTANYQALPGGFLSKVKDSDVGVAVFELVGLASKLNQNIGRIVQPTCDADVGDTRCGINLASYTYSSTVTAVTSRSVFAGAPSASPIIADGYFAYGKVTWTSGANTGIISEVKQYASGQFTLMQSTPSAIAVGDGFDASAGCDRLHATCISKFNNVTNFRGLPFNPDALDLLSGPKQ